MTVRKLTIEHLLFFIALVLALSLRVINLGAAPLSDTEANWALQALQVGGSAATALQTAPAIPQTYAWGPQPGYVLLTGAAFQLFGASNALARLWPALVGSLLILLPLFFRRELGRPASLILAFGLAIDPGLVAVSRQAGSPMPALVFVLLALCLWRARRPILAGIVAGLALLSGPSVLMGALGIGLAWGLTLVFSPKRPTEPASPQFGPAERNALLAAGAVVVLAGTLFLFRLQGLAAWAETLPTFIQGWFQSSGVPAASLPAALLFYQPMALIFGLLGAVQGIFLSGREDEEFSPNPKRAFFIYLILWAFAALVLGLVYPGRQVSDLIWVLVPLWALASLQLTRFLPNGQASLVAASQGVLVFLLLALFWLTLDGVAQPSAGAIELRFGVLVGLVALAALTTLLVALGWSWEVGRRGLLWGTTAALTIYLVSALWGATQLRPGQPQELWSPTPGTGEINLFMKTLGDFSEWRTGFRTNLDLTVAVDTPSLRWALRDFPQARFVSQPSASELPSVIITRQGQQAPALTASYRGEAFSWWVKPGWTGTFPPDFVRWLTFREAPQTPDQVILWTRSDLFPGGALENKTTP
ncbi:MAG TPA: hypothetical protein VF823_05505 [Anaerolineales bacterium]